MTERFDNEESTGFVSDIPEEAVNFLLVGDAMKMMVKAIFQRVHDSLNKDPELQKEFDAALRVFARYGKGLPQGEVFYLSEPQFMGEFQVRPADLKVGEPSKKLGWTCHEQRGWEVKLISESFDQQIIKCSKEEDKHTLINACPNMTEAKVGTRVLAMGIMGWVRGVVRDRSEFVSFWHVDAGGTLFPLELADDERNCWVTTSQINKSVFKMELKR